MQDDPRIDRLLDLVAGMFAAHNAVLLGMIGQQIVNGRQLQEFLHTLIADLRPDERDGSYAMSLSLIARAIEQNDPVILKPTLQ